MQIDTARFGQITVNDSGIITFLDGILGFGDQRRYVLLETAEYAPLKWLQSVEAGWLAFVLLEPEEFLDEYDVEIDSDSISELDLSSPEKAIVYTIVTASETPKDTTANLQAPIILNPTNQLAKQIVLHNSPYSIRHPVLGNGNSK